MTKTCELVVYPTATAALRIAVQCKTHAEVIAEVLPGDVLDALLEPVLEHIEHEREAVS